MKKVPVLIAAFLLATQLQAQPIDYDNLAKEYRDIAAQAMASAKPSTRKWVEETALKHPAGNFDPYWAKNQLGGLPANLGSGDPSGGLWVVMIAYQKLLNQEHKAEQKSSKNDAAQELKYKENKAALDNRTIDQQKREAEERYETSKDGVGTDHRKGMQDMIKKFQDQLAEFKRNPNF